MTRRCMGSWRFGLTSTLTSQLPDPGGHPQRCAVALGGGAARAEDRERLLAEIRRAGLGTEIDEAAARRF